MRLADLAPFAAPAVLAALATACAAPSRPAAPPPLAIRAHVPATFEAEVVGRALPWSDVVAGVADRDAFPSTREAARARIEHAVERRVAQEAGEPEPPLPDLLADGPMIEVEGRLVRVDRATARAVFGWTPGATIAFVADRAEARERLDALEEQGFALDVQSPRLVLKPEQPSSISVVNQTAFVERFALVAGADQLVADPVVGVVQDGLVVGARPALPDADGRCGLDLDLVIASLLRPIATQDVPLPGGGREVRLQTPATTRQRLSTHARLAAEDVLVLGGLETPGEEGVLFFVVRCAPFVAPAASEPED